MDSVINELIKIDRRAQNTVEEAQSRLDEARIKIEREKQSIYDDSEENFKRMLIENENEVHSETKCKLEELEKKYTEAEKQMDDYFNANRDIWIKNITKECLS